MRYNFGFTYEACAVGFPFNLQTYILWEFGKISPKGCYAPRISGNIDSKRHRTEPHESVSITCVPKAASEPLEWCKNSVESAANCLILILTWAVQHKRCTFSDFLTDWLSHSRDPEFQGKWALLWRKGNKNKEREGNIRLLNHFVLEPQKSFT